MTTTHHSKVLTQIKDKPGKYAKYKKHNVPKERQSGKTKRPCVRCGRFGGHIRSFSLGLCRQCFRENATELGFKQYS